MIDLHTARNAVKEKTNEVFAEAVHRRFVIRLREDDSRNQGFVEASFVEGTGNYGGDDRAVRHAILRGLREKEKAHLSHAKGIDGSLDDGDGAEHTIGIFEVAVLFQQTGRQLVVVGILEHPRAKARGVGIRPNIERKVVDIRGSFEELTLKLGQFSIHINLFLGRWLAG